MRRYPITWSILIFTVVMLVVIWRLHAVTEFNRLDQVSRIRNAPSRLYARMLIRYDKPPIYEEEYRMSDVEGVSSFDYRVRGYNGRQVTVTVPPRVLFDVSYFFGWLDQQGIWQLPDQVSQGDTNAHYTIYVKQYADFQHGE